VIGYETRNLVRLFLRFLEFVLTNNLFIAQFTSPKVETNTAN